MIEKLKKWNKGVISVLIAMLLAVAAFVIIIDPFWHFHGPVSGLSYPLKDERYCNDGIARHSDYEAVIAGSSMTLNFKPSEFEKLFGTKTIKLAYSGASFKEVNEGLKKVYLYQPETKYILRCLDISMLGDPGDDKSEYTDYLSDSNPFNDFKYIFNKEVILKSVNVLNYTRVGNKTPTPDEYASFSQYGEYGKESVLSKLLLDDIEYAADEENFEIIEKNITENVCALAKEHPETQFFIFFPPYSMAYWYKQYLGGTLDLRLKEEELAARILLEQKNIRVFSFHERLDITANLDNYQDLLHYGEWINSEILLSVKEGLGELTEENYVEYFKELKKVLSEYPYEEEFAKEE